MRQNSPIRVRHEHLRGREVLAQIFGAAVELELNPGPLLQGEHDPEHAARALHRKRQTEAVVGGVARCLGDVAVQKRREVMVQPDLPSRGDPRLADEPTKPILISNGLRLQRRAGGRRRSVLTETVDQRQHLAAGIGEHDHLVLGVEGRRELHRVMKLGERDVVRQNPLGVAAEQRAFAMELLQPILQLGAHPIRGAG